MFFQKYVTKGVELSDDYFRVKLQHAMDHDHYLRKYHSMNHPLTILELGTGWYPIVPIVFFLTGCGEVTSIDSQNWITRDSQIRTIRKFMEWRAGNKFPPPLLRNVTAEKWDVLFNILEHSPEISLEEINQKLGLRYHIQDARNLSFQDDSVDFICSNNTLEHIHSDHLRPILREFARVLKPDGVMSHFIDMSDHFAHFDQNINIYNFLKFSRKQWSLIDNRIQHLNRLRLVDYKSVYRESGILISEEVIRNGSLADLESIRVHKEFSDYSMKDLAVSHAYLISGFSASQTGDPSE
ncbi:MAG: class I SAM-dependent methyltransferase [Bacteroidota bacterium]